MGPLVAPETTQPDLLLSHFAKRKAILSTPLPFIPSIQAAIALRGQGEVYGIQPEFAQLLMPRGLRPLVKLQDEATTRMGEEEKGQKKKGVVLQGWTLRSDPLLEAIKETQYVSEGYAKTFMGRIQCPVLCILASKNLARPKMAKCKKKKKKNGGPIHANLKENRERERERERVKRGRERVTKTQQNWSCFLLSSFPLSSNLC